MFKGSIVALITPFKNNKLDEECYISLVHHHIKNGTSGLVPAGTTGESPTLNHDEHERVIELCVKESKGKIPVIAGTGSNSTEEAVSLTKHAEKAGADGALVVTPYYNKPTQEGLYQHFKAVAEACPIPVILYNVPGRTSKNMEPITSLRLANDIENIVAIKEAGNNPDQYRELIRKKPDDFLVISGDDDLVLDVILEGGSGVISVIGQALVSDFSKMIQMGLKGDSDAAKTIEKRVMPLIELIFEENNPAGIKAVLNHMQLCEDFVRLPLVVATNTLKSKIAAAILQMKSQ